MRIRSLKLGLYRKFLRLCWAQGLDKSSRRFFASLYLGVLVGVPITIMYSRSSWVPIEYRTDPHSFAVFMLVCFLCVVRGLSRMKQGLADSQKKR